MVFGDLGKHPTVPPQSFWSKVHRRCNLLLCVSWSAGSIRGLGWEASVVRCLLIRSWMTVRTYGMCRSVWSVWLVTYQGALVMVRRSLDWYLCMIAIGFVGASPQFNSIGPYKFWVSFYRRVVCFLVIGGNFFRWAILSLMFCDRVVSVS